VYSSHVTFVGSTPKVPPTTHVLTFFFAVTVMEMKHAQGYLLDTLSPPVVCRKGGCGGGGGHGGVLPQACVLTGYNSRLDMWLYMSHVCILFVSMLPTPRLALFSTWGQTRHRVWSHRRVSHLQWWGLILRLSAILIKRTRPQMQSANKRRVRLFRCHYHQDRLPRFLDLCLWAGAVIMCGCS